MSARLSRVVRVTASAIVVIGLIVTELTTQWSLTWPHVVLIAIGLLPLYFQEIAEFRLSVSGTEIHIKKLEERIDEINSKTEDVYSAGSDDTLRLPDETPGEITFSEFQWQVFEAFQDSRFRFRSATGIANQIIADRDQVFEAIEKLEKEGMIRRTRSSEKQLWTLSATGLATINRYKAEDLPRTPPPESPQPDAPQQPLRATG